MWMGRGKEEGRKEVAVVLLCRGKNGFTLDELLFWCGNHL